MSFYHFGQPISRTIAAITGESQDPANPVPVKSIPFGTKLEHAVKLEEEDESAFCLIQDAKTFRTVAAFLSNGPDVRPCVAAAVLHRWARFVKQGACRGVDIRHLEEFNTVTKQLDATQLDPQSITNALWALGVILGKRDYTSDFFFRQIVQEFLRRRAEFEPQNLSISVWAMATLTMVP